MKHYTTQFLRSPDELAGVAKEWLRCREPDKQPHIENHPDWLIIESKSQANLLAITLRDADQFVGAAPFIIRPWSWPCRLGYRAVVRFPLTIADLCGETFLLPADAEAYDAIFSALANAPLRYDMVFFENLATDSELWRAIHESPLVRKHFWVYCPFGTGPRRVIHLTGTFDDYLKQLSRNTRSQLGRRARRLEEACKGQLALECIRQREQLPAFMQQVEQISQRSWQGTKLGAVVRATPAALERLGARADRGWLRCYLLRTGDQPLAYILGWQSDGVYYYDDAAFDPAWGELSAGKVVLYRAIQDLFAHDKPEWFDFGAGDNQYKETMSNHAFTQANVFLFRKTPYNALAVGTHRACKTATALVRSILDRLRLREKVRQLLRRS